MAYDYIIGVDQLRSEVGSPTADPREPGAVTDEELQGIIDQGEDTVDRVTKSRLETRVLENTPPSASHVFNQTTISLSEDTPYARGAVPPRYYALSFDPAEDTNGNIYEHDRNLESEGIGYFNRRRYKFVGRGVIAIPLSTDAIRVRLPVKEKTRRVVSEGVIQKVNESIIQRAWEMVQRKQQVGSALEQSDLDQ